jgi:predicted nucleic acid-binding Zn ribbon protein
MKKKETRICAVCGKKFTPKVANAKVCSEECRKAWKAKRDKKRYSNAKSIKEACVSAPKFNAVERIKISVAKKPKACTKKCEKHSNKCPDTALKVLPAVAVALIVAGSHLLKMLECASLKCDKGAKVKKQKTK